MCIHACVGAGGRGWLGVCVCVCSQFVVSRVFICLYIITGNVALPELSTVWVFPRKYPICLFFECSNFSVSPNGNLPE